MQASVSVWSGVFHVIVKADGAVIASAGGDAVRLADGPQQRTMQVAALAGDDVTGLTLLVQAAERGHRAALDSRRRR